MNMAMDMATTTTMTNSNVENLTSLASSITPDNTNTYTIGASSNLTKSVYGVNVRAFSNVQVYGDIAVNGTQELDIPTNTQYSASNVTSRGTFSDGDYEFPGRMTIRTGAACNINGMINGGYVGNFEVVTQCNQSYLYPASNAGIVVGPLAFRPEYESNVKVDVYASLGINSVSATGPRINFFSASGSPEDPQPTATGSILMNIEHQGYDGSNFVTGAAIRGIATGDYANDQGGAALHFLSAGGESNELIPHLVINENGYVGIGTSNPGYTLDVEGDVNFTGTIYIIGLNSNNKMYVLNSNAMGWVSHEYDAYYPDGNYWDKRHGNIGIKRTYAYWPLDISGSIRTSGTILKNGQPYEFLNDDWVQDGSSNVYTNPSDFIGIGTEVVSYPLHVQTRFNYNVGIYTNGILSEASDARLKTDLQPITGALDKVCSVHGYTYTASNIDGIGIDNDNEHEGSGNKRMTGVLAQEIMSVLPEVVTYDNTLDQYHVAYGNIIPLLVEALKELKAKHDAIYERKVLAATIPS
jgi:hypothetical protein